MEWNGMQGIPNSSCMHFPILKMALKIEVKTVVVHWSQNLICWVNVTRRDLITALMQQNRGLFHTSCVFRVYINKLDKHPYITKHPHCVHLQHAKPILAACCILKLDLKYRKRGMKNYLFSKMYWNNLSCYWES